MRCVALCIIFSAFVSCVACRWQFIQLCCRQHRVEVRRAQQCSAERVEAARVQNSACVTCLLRCRPLSLRHRDDRALVAMCARVLVLVVDARGTRAFLAFIREACTLHRIQTVTYRFVDGC